MDLIRDQKEKQLVLIGKINTDKTKKIGDYDAKNKTAVELVNKIKKEIKNNRNRNFVCTNTRGEQYDFNQYRDLNQFGNEIYSDKITLDEARDEQYNMQILINKLKAYSPTNPKK